MSNPWPITTLVIANRPSLDNRNDDIHGHVMTVDSLGTEIAVYFEWVGVTDLIGTDAGDFAANDEWPERWGEADYGYVVTNVGGEPVEDTPLLRDADYVALQKAVNEAVFGAWSRAMSAAEQAWDEAWAEGQA